MKIAILGSGITACLASWALRAHDVVMISPSGKIGGCWGSGPIRITTPTQILVDALEWAGCEYVVRQVTVGVATIDGGKGVCVDAEDYVPHDDEPYSYLRRQFEMMPTPVAKRLEMPDPIAAFSQVQGSELASLEILDPLTFMQAAADDCRIVTGGVSQIRSGWVTTDSGEHVDCDMTIAACPLEPVRAANRRQLSRASHGITSLWWLPTEALPGIMYAHDVVHVAAVKSQRVFRISNVAGGYWIEASGIATRHEVRADCEYLLGPGFQEFLELKGLIRGAPCGTPPESNDRKLRFLGPLARCDARECAGTTAIRASSLALEIG